MASPSRAGIPVDPFRMLSFPNAMRERRVEAGFSSLLALAGRLPHIPYVRLSKIERGEVFARASELQDIAGAIGLDDPGQLLVDVESPDFSIGLWAGSHGHRPAGGREAQELAVLLAAAFRARRAGDPALTLAELQERHGLPAVIVSRVENAAKPVDRWNEETLAALCALFAVPDRDALTAHLRDSHKSGALAGWLERVPGVAERETRTRERVCALRTELARLPPLTGERRVADPGISTRAAGLQGLTILGVPVGDGVIELFPGPQSIEPPHGSGTNAYALRMCRASLGAAIPGNAVLIVDPDRYPVTGGLAVLREEKGVRVLVTTIDRDGHLWGHSSNPEKEIALDAVAPADLAMVTAVLFPDPL